MWLKGNCDAKRNILNKRSHVSVSLWYFPKKILRKFLNCLITNISVLQQKAIFFCTLWNLLAYSCAYFWCISKEKSILLYLVIWNTLLSVVICHWQNVRVCLLFMFILYFFVCCVLSSLPLSFTSCLLSTSLNLSYLQVSHQCLIPPSCASLSFVKASSITPRVLFFVSDWTGFICPIGLATGTNSIK